MADICLRLGTDVLILQGLPTDDLHARDFEDPLPVLNVTEPESVAEVHQLQRAAGAMCGLTNTLGASSDILAGQGIIDGASQMALEGVRLALAAGYEHVLAVLGPCSIPVEPGSGCAALRCRNDASQDAACAGTLPEAFEQAFDLYQEAAADLAAGKPDALLLLGFASLDDALAACLAAQKATSLPVFVVLQPTDTQTPVDVAHMLKTLHDAGAAAAGCMNLPCEPMHACMREAAAICPGFPLIALPAMQEFRTTPGAGLRPRVDYDALADEAVQFLRDGVRLIGAGQGGTPACTGVLFATLGGVSFPEA